MRFVQRSSSLAVIAILSLCVSFCQSQKFGDSVLVYEWSSLDFDWPSEEVRAQAIADGSFQIDKNLLAGIKVYNGTVFVTVPRWRAYKGFPVTLATVVKVNGKTLLRPYPDWESQTIGDCNDLQFVQSMEIDSNTGLMYVIDTGRIGIASIITPQNLCPAKLVVYDLSTNKKVASHDFPDNMVNRTENFINDIVLDYVDGEVRFAYMSDVFSRQMHIFDFKTNETRNLEDPESMGPENGAGPIIKINGQNYTFNAGIDGIAMSPDFDYVFYCSLGGYDLYSVPTSTLRNGGSNGIRRFGTKISQTDGMAFSSTKRLYYGALGLNSVYYWDPKVDMRKQGASFSDVNLETESKLTGDDTSKQWPDTLAFDEQGWLWFISNRLHLFSTGTMNFSEPEINMRIWKVFVNETSYLHNADVNTRVNKGVVISVIGKTHLLVYVVICNLLISKLLSF